MDHRGAPFSGGIDLYTGRRIRKTSVMEGNKKNRASLVSLGKAFVNNIGGGAVYGFSSPKA